MQYRYLFCSHSSKSKLGEYIPLVDLKVKMTMLSKSCLLHLNHCKIIEVKIYELRISKDRI